MSKILFIDNYDSFTHNLVQMFMRYDLAIDVRRSDKIPLEEINRMLPDYIVISPGPKDPAHAGVSTDVVKAFTGKIPILGVCLGMQCINEALDGATVRAPVPVHGKTSKVFHLGRGIFQHMPSPFTAARYHSLMIRPRSDALKVTATSDDGVIMAIEHADHPVFGVQFHPESFLTESGNVLIENFLKTGRFYDQLYQKAV
jgi:anthranilate synthase component II